MRFFKYISLCILLLFGSVGYSQSLVRVDPFNQFEFLFDAVDELVRIDGVAPILNTTGSGTWSCWIIPDGLVGTQTIISCARNSASAYSGRLYISNSGKLHFDMFRQGFFSQTAVTDDIVLTDGVRQHIMITGGVGDYELYVDNVFKSSTLFGANRWFNDFSGNTIPDKASIGCFTNNSDGQFFKGKIDEVSMWNGEADASQRAELFNNGIPGNLRNHSNALNLLGWWRMGEGATFSTNWAIPDISTNSSNGTSVNMEESDRVLSTLPNVRGLLMIGNNLMMQ